MPSRFLNRSVVPRAFYLVVFLKDKLLVLLIDLPIALLAVKIIYTVSTPGLLCCLCVCSVLCVHVDERIMCAHVRVCVRVITEWVKPGRLERRF